MRWWVGSVLAGLLILGQVSGAAAAGVVNPASGATLYVQTLVPAGWNGERLPTLVLVPGGNGDSTIFTGGGRAQQLANAGFVVVVFDPDGRGKSGGVEDYGGFIQQDGLRAVIEAARAHPAVDPGRIGLVSNSYGVTMAAGVLARYPEMGVRFLIDWEGPIDRTDTAGCDGARGGHLRMVAACDDEAFWQQREAITFIASIGVPYQRMQSERDHVQPDVLHAVRIVNAAVAAEVPWVRLNDYPPNQTYRLDDPPAMAPDTQDRRREATIARYANELFALDCRAGCRGSVTR
ncbi:MAG: CocE/NonD family hydrolase [Dehalococcoidia bacterium]